MIKTIIKIHKFDKRQITLFILGIITFVLTFTSLTRGTALQILKDSSQIPPIFYFTYQSNIFLSFTMIFLPFWLYAINSYIKSLFFASVILITITFCVYWPLIFVPERAKYYNNFVELMFTTFVHFVNPVLAIIALIISRKYIFLYESLFFKVALYGLLYYLLIFIIYFSFQRTKNGSIAIYTFVDFYKPLFYSGNNKFIIVILNIFLFLTSYFLPVMVGFALKAIFRIDSINYRVCFLKGYNYYITNFYKNISKKDKILEKNENKYLKVTYDKKEKQKRKDEIKTK